MIIWMKDDLTAKMFVFSLTLSSGGHSHPIARPMGSVLIV